MGESSLNQQCYAPPPPSAICTWLLSSFLCRAKKRDAHPHTLRHYFFTPQDPLTSGWCWCSLELRFLDFGAIRASGPFFQVPSEAHVSLCSTCGKWGLSGSKKDWRAARNELKAVRRASEPFQVSMTWAQVCSHIGGAIEMRGAGAWPHQAVMGPGGKGTLSSQDARNGIRPKPSGCGILSSKDRFWKIEA